SRGAPRAYVRIALCPCGSGRRFERESQGARLSYLRLPRNRGQVPADSDVRQSQLVRDLFRGHPFAASCHHVDLAPRQVQLESIDRGLLLPAAAQLVDQRADSRAGDDRVAVEGNLDRAAETTRT